MRILFFISFFFLLNSIIGQNLVLNPSFEQLRNLPVKKNPKRHFTYELKSGYIPYIKNLKYWFAGSNTTPDLRIHDQGRYNECKRKFKNCDRPHSGKNSVGLMTFMQNSKHKTYREYVQIKLKKRLKPKVKTYVEFWTTKEREAKLVSNNLGCYFAMKKVYSDTKETIDVVPQINVDSIVNLDHKEWVKLEAVFYPEQAFEFLLIGNFFRNENTKTETFKDYRGSSWTPPYAYYLLDDIKVWQEGDVEEKPLVFDKKEIEKEEPIRLKNIEFEFNSSQLMTVSFIELNKLLDFLKTNPSVKIKIQGHTDNKGNQLFNQNLSEKRAKAVLNFLLKQGIESNRLTSIGYGENNPIELNNTDEGRSRNRRVEFLVLEK